MQSQPMRNCAWNPVWNLESLNTRFWQWLEKEYHRRATVRVANIRLIASPKKRPPCANFPLTTRGG
jgi:hypothetical protein